MQKQKEYIYQFILIILLFVFTVFDEEDQYFQWKYLLITGNYVVGTIIINYIFLPRLYYKKRVPAFWTGLVFVILSVIVIEELVWEPFFFMDRQADNIKGILFSFADAIPVMAILVGFKFLWDANQRRKELDALKQLMMENEMQILKSQINPHFLFNNLNNLYSYAIENSPKTPTIIHKLSSVLRYMLYDCREKFVPLRNEIQHLENFIQLNEIQMEHRGTVDFRNNNINHSHLLAPLILIVFVENAFKHSLSSQSVGIKIAVHVEVEDDTLFFRCENSYSNNSNLQDLSKGIGLKNVIAQLKLLYPDAHKLEISKTEKLYSVQLSIDLKKSAQ